MKKGGQLELLALLSIVLSMSWKEEEQKKLLTSSHSELAFAGSTYYLLSTRAGPAAFYPLKSVAVACFLHRPCPSCQTSESLREL